MTTQADATARQVKKTTARVNRVSNHHVYAVNNDGGRIDNVGRQYLGKQLTKRCTSIDLCFICFNNLSYST